MERWGWGSMERFIAPRVPLTASMALEEATLAEGLSCDALSDALGESTPLLA